ncbi:MAG: hypothetical protein ACP5OX_02690, partial [Minisyncoccia bacterium]
TGRKKGCEGNKFPSRPRFRRRRISFFASQKAPPRKKFVFTPPTRAHTTDFFYFPKKILSSLFIALLF